MTTQEKVAPRDEKTEMAAKFLEVAEAKGAERDKLLKANPELVALLDAYNDLASNSDFKGLMQDGSLSLLLAKEIQEGHLTLIKPDASQADKALFEQSFANVADYLLRSHHIQEQSQSQGIATADSPHKQTETAPAENAGYKQLQANVELMHNIERTTFLRAVAHPEHAAEIIDNNKDVQVAFSFYNAMKQVYEKNGLDNPEQDALKHLRDNLGKMLASDDRTAITQLSMHIESKIPEHQTPEPVRTIQV